MHLLSWFDLLRTRAQVSYPGAQPVVTVTVLAQAPSKAPIAESPAEPGVVAQLVVVKDGKVHGESEAAASGSHLHPAVTGLAAKFGHVVEVFDPELGHADTLLAPYRGKFGSRALVFVATGEGMQMTFGESGADGAPDPARTHVWMQPAGADKAAQDRFDAAVLKMMKKPGSFPTLAALAHG